MQINQKYSYFFNWLNKIKKVKEEKKKKNLSRYQFMGHID